MSRKSIIPIRVIPDLEFLNKLSANEQQQFIKEFYENKAALKDAISNLTDTETCYKMQCDRNEKLSEQITTLIQENRSLKLPKKEEPANLEMDVRGAKIKLTMP